jgi:hypothetical protein
VTTTRHHSHTRRAVRAVGFALTLALAAAACIPIVSDPPTAEPVTVDTRPPALRTETIREGARDRVRLLDQHGTVVAEALGSPGTRIDTRIDGGTVVSSVTPGTAGTPADYQRVGRNPVLDLQDLGAPLSIIRQFTDRFGTFGTTIVGGRAVLMSSSTGGTIYDSACITQRRPYSAAKAYGCVIRYTGAENDPDSYYRWDETGAFGHGASMGTVNANGNTFADSEDALLNMASKVAFNGYMVPVKWAPTSTLKSSSCKSISFGVSLYGVGVTAGTSLCPKEIVPWLSSVAATHPKAKDAFAALWKGESDRTDEVVGTATATIFRGDCFCVDGFVFELVSTWCMRGKPNPWVDQWSDSYSGCNFT